jgi:hypothetical protein
VLFEYTSGNSFRQSNDRTNKRGTNRNERIAAIYRIRHNEKAAIIHLE